ncbi:MAG: hypothetical protein QOI06_2713 [Nocardioidaceae bacterium]|jgi:NTP pyrophosphatase (non-canonical NTP hydrolase)|nr:hypothetical protein [Nocardioidaceae bacterium]
MTLDELREELRRFADERDWQQFHTPKNLVMALAGEVGELTEIFQWLTPHESTIVMRTPQSAAHLREELSDVFGYLVRLADVLEVDLLAALQEKIRVNEQRYPVERAKGNALKYTDLPRD